MKYNLTQTKNPSFGILASDNSFVYVERRIGQVTESFSKTVIRHIEYLETFKAENNLNGFLQLRSLYYNDKGGEYKCNVDYLIDHNEKENPEISLGKSIRIIEGQDTNIELKVIKCFFGSEHFDKNHRDYYSEVIMF
ncbi:hypothetical protein BFP78_13295 [Gaetbulibacter sp. 5U11]|nr:hypothetical protein BFP78_13295 [Gaetbulibacter sp. 5U11]